MMGGMAAPGMSGVGAATAIGRPDQPRGFPKPSELTMPGEIPPSDLSPAAAVEPPTPDGHGNFEVKELTARFQVVRCSRISIVDGCVEF